MRVTWREEQVEKEELEFEAGSSHTHLLDIEQPSVRARHVATGTGEERNLSLRQAAVTHTCWTLSSHQSVRVTWREEQVEKEELEFEAGSSHTHLLDIEQPSVRARHVARGTGGEGGT